MTLADFKGSSVAGRRMSFTSPLVGSTGAFGGPFYSSWGKNANAPRPSPWIREALIEEGEERTVTVGDTVKYVDLERPGSVLSAQITENKTDSAAGLYHRGTPFARTMIGAAVGAEVTLQLPLASSRTFRILEIQRSERS
jgi:hypothetical protein